MHQWHGPLSGRSESALVPSRLRKPGGVKGQRDWGREKKSACFFFFFFSPNYDIKKACQTRRRRLRRLRSIFRRVCQRRGAGGKREKKKCMSARTRSWKCEVSHWLYFCLTPSFLPLAARLEERDQSFCRKIQLKKKLCTES